LVNQGKAAGVRTFVKQLGSMPYEPEHTGDACAPDNCYRLADKKGDNPADWPKHLRVQERLVW